jgi:hypothetical protein
MTTSNGGFEVSQTSPVCSVGGIAHTGLLGYGWTAEDPFAVTLRITLAMNSFPVEADEFPGGLTCCECRREISWGGFACNTGEGYICCLGCGRTSDKLGLEQQDWIVGLQLFVNAMESRDSSKLMPGEVQVYRAANGEVTIVLSNRDTKQSIRLVAPYANLVTFLKNIVKVRDTKGRDLEGVYLHQGVSELEKWANEVK